MRTALKSLAAAGLVPAVLAFMLGVAAAQGPQFVPRDESPEDFPAGPGRDDAFYACTACHGFKLIAQQGMSRRQWEESIGLMVARHNMPPLPARELQTVLDYLATTYPPRVPVGGRGWQNPFAPR